MDVYIKSHATHEIKKSEKLYFQLGNGEIEIIYSVNNATSSANLYWDILHPTYTMDKNLLKKIVNYGLKCFLGRIEIITEMLKLNRQNQKMLLKLLSQFYRIRF